MPRIILNTNTKKENVDNLSKSEWFKITISTGFLIFVYFIFSIGLTFYQRWFLKSYKIPLTAVTCHLILKFILSAIFRFVFQWLTGEKRIILNWTTNFMKLAPIGFSGGLDVAFSNWGLALITVSLYTMTKSSSIVFILLFALLFRLESKSWIVFAIVTMISSGLVLFTYQSTQFNFAGFVLVLLASFMSGLRWSMTQFIMQQTNLGLRNPVDMMYHVQLWMFVLVGPLAFLLESTMVKELWASNDRFELSVLVISGALIAFALEVTEFLILWHTSSLTLAVSGIVKEICALVLAYEWSGDQMTLVNFFGLLLCLGGVVSHVLYKARHVERVRQKSWNDEATASFLPVVSNSSDDENANFDDDSSTEVLFNVLQIRDKPSIAITQGQERRLGIHYLKV